MLDRGPIFIGGLDRSGKTYMRFMLSSHPDITLTRRTNMWPNFYNRFGDLSRVDNFERCLEAMMQYKHIHSLEPDLERIRREFWQESPTYARLFALIHEQYAQRQGKSRWGDQTELIERFADLIFDAYPNARLIQMIRDPRDHFEASKQRRRNSKGRVGDSTARWLYSISLARRNQRNYPDRYKIVRYETMVSQPEETMRDVCGFLGEEYSPGMLTMQGVPRFWKENGLQVNPGDSPLRKDFIGSFRRGISQNEIAFIQKYAGRYMLLYDYLLEPIRLSTGEKLHFYLVDWGVNVARMQSWYAMKLFQREFTTKVGVGL